jgi:hypothetical protein
MKELHQAKVNPPKRGDHPSSNANQLMQWLSCCAGGRLLQNFPRTPPADFTWRAWARVLRRMVLLPVRPGRRAASTPIFFNREWTRIIFLTTYAHL